MIDRIIPRGTFKQEEIETMRKVYEEAVVSLGITSNGAKEQLAKVILGLCDGGVPDDLAKLVVGRYSTRQK